MFKRLSLSKSILIIFCAAVSVGSLFAVSKKKGHDYGSSPQSVGSPLTASQDATSSSDNQDGWSDYHNTKFNLRFKYPGNWNLADSQDPFGVEVISPDKKAVFSIKPVNVGRESVFDLDAGVQINPFLFKGRAARQYTCPDQNSCPSQLVAAKAIRMVDLPGGWEEYNEIDYEIYQGFAGEMQLPDGILSTLEFSR